MLVLHVLHCIYENFTSDFPRKKSARENFGAQKTFTGVFLKIFHACFFVSRVKIWQNLHAHLHGQLLVRNLHGLLFASRVFLHEFFTVRKLKFHGGKKQC